MLVKNFKSKRGHVIENQFLIERRELIEIDGKLNYYDVNYFQSYDTMIAKKIPKLRRVILNTEWKFSKTTSKYLSIFLNESTKETQARVDSGEHKLENLN